MKENRKRGYYKTDHRLRNGRNNIDTLTQRYSGVTPEC